ncbi:MAG TPA: O-antigen ligase family protein [Solirubrobacteraceae bacterium]|nr:O-antigen ligase family protein [Solirubrobacteraceae bacterium]
MFGDTADARVLALCPFVVVILATSTAVRPNVYRPDPKFVFALWAYLAVTTITIIRGVGVVGGDFKSARSGYVAALSIALVAWFAFRLLASSQTSDERRSRLAAIALAPATFVAFNLLALHVRIPFISIPAHTDVAEGTHAVLLDALGFPTVRTSLPFTAGANASGAISAAGFAAAVLLALRPEGVKRLVTIPAAGACLYATLLSDSRTALAIAVGVVVLFVVAPRARRFSCIIGIALLAPVYLLGILRLASSLGIGVASRSSSDLSSGDHRNVIWEGAWMTIRHGDLWHGIFGYGAYGQVTSGSIFQYLHLFYSATPIYPTSHNLALQTILDSGVIGVLVLVGLAVAAFSALSRVAVAAPSPERQALTAILIVVILNGATEALPSYIFPETLDLALLVAAAGIALEAGVARRALLSRPANIGASADRTQSRRVAHEAPGG